MKVRWQSGATYSSHNNVSRPPWPPASRGSQSTNTHIGEKFKRQFGAVFTNPKDKGQTTTSDVYGSSIQSSSRLLACVYNIIFASSFWGSDRQTGERASTAYVPGEQQRTPSPRISLCFISLLVSLVLLFLLTPGRHEHVAFVSSTSFSASAVCFPVFSSQFLARLKSIRTRHPGTAPNIKCV